MCRKKCAEKLQKPQQFVGANVSFILGHFQKCLTFRGVSIQGYETREIKMEP